MSADRSSSVSSETLYSVQYLRAAAALAVVLYHISALSQVTWGLDPERIDHVGAAGVDLFFVISGFVMAMIVARPGAFDGREFWIRRVARVVPAYWVITLVVFVLAWSMPSLFNSTTADLSTLLASLAFIALDHGDGSTAPLLVVGWTLNYEIFFYAVVALTAGLFGDRKLIGASAVLVCLIGLGQIFNPSSLTLAFYTDPILLEFVFGIVVYQVWNRTPQARPSLAQLAIFLLGALLLIAQWERPAGELRMLFWGIPSMAVLYGGLGTLSLRSALLARLGDWSYALYLTHVFVVTLYIKHVISAPSMAELPWQAHYLIMTTCAVLSAAAYHMIIETPLSRWTLRKLRRRSAAAAAPAAPVAEAAEKAA